MFTVCSNWKEWVAFGPCGLLSKVVEGGSSDRISNILPLFMPSWAYIQLPILDVIQICRWSRSGNKKWTWKRKQSFGIWCQQVSEWCSSLWREKRLLVSRTKPTCWYLSPQFPISVPIPLRPSIGWRILLVHVDSPDTCVHQTVLYGYFLISWLWLAGVTMVTESGEDRKSVV